MCVTIFLLWFCLSAVYTLKSDSTSTDAVVTEERTWTGLLGAESQYWLSQTVWALPAIMILSFLYYFRLFNNFLMIERRVVKKHGIAKLAWHSPPHNFITLQCTGGFGDEKCVNVTINKKWMDAPITPHNLPPPAPPPPSNLKTNRPTKYVICPIFL